jgi:hypothetical protein
MYYYPRWLPAERLLIVQKARTWGGVLAVKAGSWGVPNGVVTTLHDRTNEAEDALNAAMAAPRSEVLNTRVRIAFEHLIAAMQDVKDRYFKSPPLLEEDLEDFFIGAFAPLLRVFGGFFTGASCFAAHSANYDC